MHISNCLIYVVAVIVDDCFVLICFSQFELFCCCFFFLFFHFHRLFQPILFVRLLGRSIGRFIRWLIHILVSVLYSAFFQPLSVFFVVKLTFYCWYCTIMWIYTLVHVFYMDLCGNRKDWLQQRVFVINKWVWVHEANEIHSSSVTVVTAEVKK